MLNDLVRDIIAIAGLVVTFVGFYLAITQIWKTTSAAKAAEEAARLALEESQRSFRKFAALFAHRFVNEVKLHIQNEDWSKAAMRAGDLADQMAQIDNQSVEKLRALSTSFTRLAAGQSERKSTRKWIELLTAVESQVDFFIRPFEERANDSQ